MKRSRHQFSLALNEEQYQILRKLKDEYSINISDCFKKFLEKKLEEQEKIKKI